MLFPVSLRHLRAFIAVAELGSVSKAAAHLFRAQSAVTRSIHELEKAFDITLFERKPTGMLLTSFGDTIQFRAMRTLEEFEKGIDEVLACMKIKTTRTKNGIVASLFSERHLVIFIRLTELQHMPTVARELGISQPAVSACINALESSLDIPLFKRTARGMVPTEAGEVLVFRIKRALSEIRHISSDIAALKGTTEGRVIIGALPLCRTHILPTAMAHVLQQHPRLRFATVEGPFDTLARLLRSGDIDFILGALRPPGYASDLASEPLMEENISIVARHGHPLTGQPITMHTLANAQWVLPKLGTPARTTFDLSFIENGMAPPAETVETSDPAILRGMLINSDMLTAISVEQVRYEIDAGTLALLPFTLPHTPRVIGITKRTESHASPGATALMDSIRNAIQDMQHKENVHLAQSVATLPEPA